MSPGASTALHPFLQSLQQARQALWTTAAGCLSQLSASANARIVLSQLQSSSAELSTSSRSAAAQKIVFKGTKDHKFRHSRKAYAAKMAAIAKAASNPTAAAAAAAAPRAPRVRKPVDPNNSKEAQQQYSLDRVVWRREVHRLVTQWRGEQRLRDAAAAAAAAGGYSAQGLPLSPQDALQQRRVSKAVEERERLTEELAVLAREKRKADVELEMAYLRMERAQKAMKKQLSAERQMQMRRANLLEASKHWVTPESLLQRINDALDSPKPFGFITTQPVHTGSSYTPQTQAQVAQPHAQPATTSTARASWWVV